MPAALLLGLIDTYENGIRSSNGTPQSFDSRNRNVGLVGISPFVATDRNNNSNNMSSASSSISGVSSSFGPGNTMSNWKWKTTPRPGMHTIHNNIWVYDLQLVIL